ncbi:MAG: NYN domain-containing protein [Syntrophaceae bacterium]|nr:NYN domain-containing protein [Syntrophaceae bacterium]
MFIIIDGYNLIRQSSKLRRYELYSLQAGRQALVSRLSEYQQKKGHKITVVFDGWQGEEREEERDRYNNVDIIYSRYGEDADTVIKRLAAQSEEETVVVSSDREIASFAASMGNTVLSSVEFESVMNRAITSLPNHNYIKASDDSGKTDRNRKRGPSRKLSKAQKYMQKIMRRL